VRWRPFIAVLILIAPVLQADERSSPLTVQGMKFSEAGSVAPRIRELLGEAVELTRRDLKYIYGVADPERGFDCSGMVFHLLLKMGAPNVPRQANTLYEYLKQKDAFHSARNDSGLSDLEPGDLLFWTGTYKIDRKVTHVMIYLGKDNVTGQRWMVGAASPRMGIDVFKFNLGESSGLGSKFIGFGKIQAFFTGKPSMAPAKTDAPAPAPSYQVCRPENTFFEPNPALKFRN